MCGLFITAVSLRSAIGTNPPRNLLLDTLSAHPVDRGPLAGCGGRWSTRGKIASLGVSILGKFSSLESPVLPRGRASCSSVKVHGRIKMFDYRVPVTGQHFSDLLRLTQKTLRGSRPTVIFFLLLVFDWQQVEGREAYKGPPKNKTEQPLPKRPLLLSSIVRRLRLCLFSGPSLLPFSPFLFYFLPPLRPEPASSALISVGREAADGPGATESRRKGERGSERAQEGPRNRAVCNFAPA